ncbi:hypothetical protein [Planctobacterium marinum]|uniref:Uncharacterized protein n=1 Tax=Planctobacterium marinum TaxID=1631968 RepID=A0AA48HU25_9ALTE|nr:hypothetical protein MACH26_13840 [Planctobacterium marinum]
MNHQYEPGEEQVFLNKLLTIDTMLPGLIASLIKRCEHCDCLQQLDGNTQALAEMFHHRAAFLKQSFQQSLNSILNNPNVVAHIALDDKELLKTQRYLAEMEKAFTPEIVRFCVPETTTK